MDRRNLLKNACSMGLCSCAAMSFLAQDIEAAETVETTQEMKDRLFKLQWWSDHCKKLNTSLWQQLQSKLDKSTLEEILESQGRQCAEAIGWAKQHKGNPEGFFKLMNNRMGEQFDYDKEAGVIMIHSKERDCDCGFVDSRSMPPCFCHCSVGWQKETYETILGKAVDIEVQESILKGNKRCVFKVTIKNDDAG